MFLYSLKRIKVYTKESDTCVYRLQQTGLVVHKKINVIQLTIYLILEFNYDFFINLRVSL